MENTPHTLGISTPSHYIPPHPILAKPISHYSYTLILSYPTIMVEVNKQKKKHEITIQIRPKWHRVEMTLAETTQGRNDSAPTIICEPGLCSVSRSMMPSQRFWGTGEQGQFYSGEGENKGLKIRGTQEHRQFGGNREHRKSRFCFRGTRSFFRGEQGNRYPRQPPPPPHTHTHTHTHTHGRASAINFLQNFTPYDGAPLAGGVRTQKDNFVTSNREIFI